MRFLGKERFWRWLDLHPEKLAGTLVLGMNIQKKIILPARRPFLASHECF
jgi:hypothetical protein